MQVINRKGEVFNVGGDEVPDGCGLRTNIFMLDSGFDDTQREIATHYSQPVHFTDALGRANQPGFRLMDAASSEAAEGARDVRKKLLSDAWRAKPDEPDEPDDDTDTTNEADDARELRKAQVSSAWQTAVRRTGTEGWTPAVATAVMRAVKTDALPDHPTPDSDAAYEAAKIAASNRWKTSTARVAEDYPADVVRQASKLATVLNISQPYVRTITPELASQVVERELTARKSHDAITTDAISAMTERAENAWRTP